MTISSWTRALVVSATIILVGIIVMGVIWLLLRVGQIVLLVLLGGLLAVVLMPFVDMLDRRRSIPRPLAVLIAYVLLALVFGGIVYLIVPPLLAQGNQLAQGLPDIVQSLVGPNSLLTRTLEGLGISPSVAGLGGVSSQVQEVVKAVVSNAATIVRDVTTIAVGFIVILVIAFYLLNEGHRFQAGLRQVIPPQHREWAEFLQDSLVNAVAGYVRAQLTVALMVGVLAGLAASLIGVRFPLIIGLLAGLLELIPFFGPTIGAIPAVVIAIFQGPWLRVGLIVAAFVVIQQIESNIVGPRIMARRVGVHPLLVIISVLAGIELAGIWGAVFAVPTVAVLVTICQRIYQANREEQDVAA